MYFKRLLALYRAKSNPTAGGPVNGSPPIPAGTDEYGNLWARMVIGSGGAPAELPVYDPLDADNNAAPIAVKTGAHLLAYDAAGWDRLRCDVLTPDSRQTNVAPWDGAALIAAAVPYIHNQSTLSKMRGTTRQTMLGSAVRAADTNTADITNYNAQGCFVIINVTVVPGADTVTPIIQGKDLSSGVYFDIFAGPAIVAAGLYYLRLHPGITPVANYAGADIIPDTWRVRMDHSAATNFTYSVTVGMPYA